MINVSTKIKGFKDLSLLEFRHLIQDDTKVLEKGVINGQFSGFDLGGDLIERNSYSKGKLEFLLRRNGAIHPEIETDYLDKLKQDILQFFSKYKPDVDAELKSAWIVIQLEGDYGVIHNHLPNDYSGIIYLECPEGINGKTYPDGMLNIMDAEGVHSIPPIPGTIYFWPSDLNHLVYPFKGRGVRKSISFNICLI